MFSITATQVLVALAFVAGTTLLSAWFGYKRANSQPGLGALNGLVLSLLIIACWVAIVYDFVWLAGFFAFSDMLWFANFLVFFLA